MRRLIIFVLFVLITAFVWRNFDVKDVFVPVRFNNYSITKGDLSFLKEKLKKANIVLLGEGLHFYKTDGASKLKVIKYLHEEMGFDVLLMEYSFYDFYCLNNSLGKSVNFEDTVLKYSRYLPKHILDVIGYVNEQKLIGHNIDLGGVDTDLSYFRKARNPFLFFLKNNHNYSNNYEIKKTYCLLQKYSKARLNNDETMILKKMLSTIRLKSIKKSYFKNDSLNNFWLQIYYNLKTELFYLDLYKRTSSLKKLFLDDDYQIIDIDDSKKRDSMMFQNFEYLKNLYPGKKIILYTSSFHIRKSVEPFKKKRKIGNRTIPLGKYISDKYKNTYHIAWIYNSVEDIKKKNSYFKRSSSALESSLYKNKMGSGFIDLHDLASKGDSIFTMYPIWQFRTKGKWIDAFDAVIYLDTARAMRGYYNYGIYNDSIERIYFDSWEKNCTAAPKIKPNKAPKNSKSSE